jgi:hypothetical protein
MLSQQPETVGDDLNKTSGNVAAAALAGHVQPDILVEGNSIRSAERLTGLHRDTIMRLLVSAGERYQKLLTTKIQNVPVADVQCDEIWTYVRKKQSRRVFGDKDYHYIGDA